MSEAFKKAAYILLFSIGIIIGIVINDIPYLRLDRNISLGDISQLLLTIAIAMFVPFYLNKQINNKRSEKDIVISYCSEQDEEIFKLKEVIDDAYNKKGPLTREISNKLIIQTKHLSRKLTNLDRVIKEFVPAKESEKILKLLAKNQLECWENLTINLRDKRPTIESDSFEKVQNALYEYSENLSKLKITVNRT